MNAFIQVQRVLLASMISLGWLLPGSARAQTDNPCGMQWEAQQIALGRGYSNEDGGVFYSMQFANCKNDGCTPKVRVQHTYPYPATVSVRLEGVGCDGKRSSGTFSTGGNEISANQPYAQGNYHNFKQIIGVLRVEVAYQKGQDRYRVEYDSRKGTTEVYINNRNAAQRAADKARADAENSAADKVAAVQKGGGLGISLGGGGSGSSSGSDRSNSGGNSNTSSSNTTSSESAGITASNARSSKISKGSTSSSKSSSSSATKKSSTTTYYPVESEHDRQMRERSSAQRARTDQANTAATVAGATMASGMVGLAMHEMDNNEEDDDLSSYLKLTIGLGVQCIPVTQNMTYNAASGSQSTNKSSSTTTDHYDARLGLLFAVFNDKFVSVRVSPFVSYGLNAFTATTTGSHLSYGSGGAIGLGHRFKLLLQSEYAFRNGTLLIDDATLNIDAAGAADYNYSTLKYGLGAYYGLSGANAFVQASVFRENLSFLKGVPASVYSYEAKFSFSLMAFSVQYSPNYPIAGKLSYPVAYQRDKQSYLSANLYVPLTLFSH